MLSIFTKKKLTEDKVANVFVNGILQLVDEGFLQVTDIINNDPEFLLPPSLKESDSDKFLLVVIAGNINYIPEYFSDYQDIRIVEKIYSKFSNVLGVDKDSFKKTIREYQTLFAKLNHPSKNTLYAMSKLAFHKYDLYDYQQEYFKKMKAPNPIFLKRMDEIMSNFLWDWNSFLEKYRVTE